MGEMRNVRVVFAFQRGHRRAVHLKLMGGRDRLLDRQAGQVVAEGDRRAGSSQHARAKALVQAPQQVAGERLQQPELNVAGDDRHRVEQPLRRFRQPSGACQNSIAHRVRQPFAACCQDFSDEERVTAGAAVELCAVKTMRLGQRRDCRRRQPLHLQPCWSRGELPE